MAETKLENINRRIRISKVIINSSLGAAAARLEKASKILEELTGQKPSLRRAKKTIRVEIERAREVENAEMNEAAPERIGPT
ncbi:MAG: 50S ribosomal protein L5 [Halobacteria archaeon]